MFYFNYLKNSSNIMKNIFNSISIYSRKKISLPTNIRNKCVIRKIDLYFFDIMKNGQIFPLKFVIFNMITDLLSVEKWTTLGRARRRFVCKNLFHLGRVSPSHFLQNVLTENSNVCFKKLLNF